MVGSPEFSETSNHNISFVKLNYLEFYVFLCKERPSLAVKAIPWKDRLHCLGIAATNGEVTLLSNKEYKKGSNHIGSASADHLMR